MLPKVVENAKIKKVAYPVRLLFADFVRRRSQKKVKKKKVAYPATASICGLRPPKVAKKVKKKKVAYAARFTLMASATEGGD